MKRKFLSLATTILALCLTACANSNNDNNNNNSGSSGQEQSETHEHTFDNSKWEFDNENHWHPSTCGHSVTTTPTPHSFKDKITEPTYENGGYTTYTCTVCGYSYKGNYTEKLVHSFSPRWSYDSECHWHACIDDGFEDLKTDEALHTYNDVVANPTYEAKGYTTHTCIVCGYSFTDNETEMLKHNYSSSWSHDNNKHWHACIDEGYEDLKSNEASHSFTDTIIEPTYENGGYTKHTCTVCGYYYTDNETSRLTYTIIWKNYDGTVLLTEQYHKGELPVYTGEAPKKQGNAQYSYSFNGWTPEIVAVEENATYTATFSETINVYTIIWANYDGTVLKTDYYEYGATPSYSGSTPTRAKTAQYSYTFVGWSDKLNPSVDDVIEEFGIVDQNKTYRAVYEQTTNNVTITYVDQAGNVLGEETIPYGTKPQGITITGNISFQTTDGIKYEGPFSRWSGGLSYAYSDETKVAITSQLTVKGYTGSTKDLVIPASIEGTYVTSIDEAAFYNNQTIETVSIPDYVTSIGQSAFQRCLNLKSFSVGANNALFSVSNDRRALIRGTTLIAFAPNGDDEYQIPNDVYTIGAYAFSSCDIRGVAFPTHYFDIEESAFSSCSSLIWLVNFLEYAHSIGDYAFFNCSSLSGDAIFGNYLTTIGSYVFMNTAIEAVLIPSSIRTIGDNAFSGSSLLGILMRSTSETGIDLGINWNGGVDVYWYSSTQKANCWHYTSGGEIEFW